MQDTKFFALNFPLVAAAIPTWKRDARHILTDHATWGYFNANTIIHQYVGGLEGARKLTNDQLLAVRDISRRSAQDLTIDIEGNHFFFIGRKGAQETAAAIKEFEERVARLKQELNAILNQ